MRAQKLWENVETLKLVGRDSHTYSLLTEIRRLDKTEHEGLRILPFYYIYKIQEVNLLISVTGRWKLYFLQK